MNELMYMIFQRQNKRNFFQTCHSSQPTCTSQYASLDAVQLTAVFGSLSFWLVEKD